MRRYSPSSAAVFLTPTCRKPRGCWKGWGSRTRCREPISRAAGGGGGGLLFIFSRVHATVVLGGNGPKGEDGACGEVREGATGPGKLVEQIMDADAKIAVTLVCGDNYAVENLAAMIAAALEQIRNAKADLFVAGPCFQTGRYGMAAGALGSAVQAKLKIPVVTAMSEANPGADLYREMLYIIDSGTNP